MKIKIYTIILLLAIIGAINWGLIGLFNFNLASLILGYFQGILRFAYILIGFSGIFLLIGIPYMAKNCKFRIISHNVALKQKINPESPLQKEQEKFIAEGGNSQPLDK